MSNQPNNNALPDQEAIILNRAPQLRALAKCASTDPTRYAIATVCFDGPHAIATDGRKLVVVPDMAPGMVGDRVVPAGPLTKLKPKDELCLNGKMEVRNPATGDMATAIPLADANYPNWRQVIPSDNGTIVIKLDASYLLQMANAMSEDGKGVEVTIEIKNPESPFIVAGQDGVSAGILMPMRAPVGYDRPHAILWRNAK